jgi:hypothetical protein
MYVLMIVRAAMRRVCIIYWADMFSGLVARAITG